MSLQDEDRTAAPTERRRKLAREQGLGPYSAELVHAARWLGITLAFHWHGTGLFQGAQRLLSQSFTSVSPDNRQVGNIVSSLHDGVWQLGGQLLSFVLCMVVPVWLAIIAQRGFQAKWNLLAPDFARLIAFNRLGRMWGADAGPRSLITAIRLAGLGGLGVWFVWSHLPHARLLLEQPVQDSVAIVTALTSQLFWQLTGWSLVMGIIDYAIEWRRFEQSLNMTPQEVREEARATSRPVLRKSFVAGS